MKIDFQPLNILHLKQKLLDVLLSHQKQEGNLEDPLDRLDKVTKQLFANIDKLGENIKKLKEENKRLKEALGIVEDPLILTPNMEIKDEYK